MIRGKELEPGVYDPEHVERVLAEIENNFPIYFASFAEQPIEPIFKKAIAEHEKERAAYRDYLDLEALDEFEHDPNAFKSHTRKHCPIIRRCLMSQDEVMNAYRTSFAYVTGRELLSPVRKIAEFGQRYTAQFKDQAHEGANVFSDLELDILSQQEYGCGGVIGYGIQSTLLYGLYPRVFAHRSQNAVWSLYFLSGRKDFDLEDGSEFMIVHPDQGTGEQNYFYPADLFGFYSLKLYLLLNSACADRGITLYEPYRYNYLAAFDDHVGSVHRQDINTFRWNSEHVESQLWF